MITVGLGILFCFAYTRRYDQLGRRERLTYDPTAQSLRGLFLAQLAIGVLGVLVISSEYATGLIRTTLTAVPQRRSVLAAKAVVFGAVAVVFAMISVFVAFFGGQAVLDVKHLGVSIGDPQVLRAVLGAGAYLTFVGLLGLAIGAIVRRTTGAIAPLVGVVLVLPILAQALPSPVEQRHRQIPTRGARNRPLQRPRQHRSALTRSRARIRIPLAPRHLRHRHASSPDATRKTDAPPE